MIGLQERQERALADLQQAVDEAVAYFEHANANLFDGYQTTREVLSHLVFWHCEHLAVTRALLAGEQPPLRGGSLVALNNAACLQLSGVTTQELTAQFVAQQHDLNALLRRLPDWTVDFPIKAGGLSASVEDRVFALAVHIDKHVATLRRTEVRSSEVY